ncbi:AraC family transcriptional regulator [Vibrio aerogenes]|uniref:AraC family transcriptional regulator n=1 Tax=Vibrio aerogenes TaxID=92172 RepID=UPI00158808CC|nr:helix-turn-helix transcriptional regulator [Vibrio aerogenes]
MPITLKDQSDLFAVKRVIDHHVTELPHQHAQGQLIWMKQGVLSAQTDHQQWLIQPGMLIWIPPYVTHQAHCKHSATLCVLYLPPDLAERWPGEVRLIQASTLAIGIIDTFLLRDISCQNKQRQLMTLLRDELEHTHCDAYILPLPEDSRLKKITDQLIQHPAMRKSLSEWGRKVGASERTLSRLFMKETGLNYRSWCHRLRHNATLAGLRDGLTNDQLAEQLGLSSGDSLSHWVQRAFGMSPGALRKTLV